MSSPLKLCWWCCLVFFFAPSLSASQPHLRSLTDTRALLTQEGPYEVDSVTYRLSGIVDKSNSKAVFVFPKQILASDAPPQKFPLIVFLHGFLAGDFLTYGTYRTMLQTVASFGFIVIAPQSCSLGCPGIFRWSTYYVEQLKLIQWVSATKGGSSQPQDTEGILQFVDHDVGYGVFGHSAGAQATARTLNNVTQSLKSSNTVYDIRAGLLLHPDPTEKTLEISVPMAAFTGSKDRCCGESTTKALYNIATGSRAYANLIGARHGEPTQLGSNDMSIYIVAWFKIFLSQSSTPQDDYLYFFNLIFGTDATSLCGGSVPMKDDCEAIKIP